MPDRSRLIIFVAGYVKTQVVANRKLKNVSQGEYVIVDDPLFSVLNFALDCQRQR